MHFGAKSGSWGKYCRSFGRGHIKDKVNFYLFRRANSFEVRSHLLAGEKVGYFTTEEIEEIKKMSPGHWRH